MTLVEHEWALAVAILDHDSDPDMYTDALADAYRCLKLYLAEQRLLPPHSVMSPEERDERRALPQWDWYSM